MDRIDSWGFVVLAPTPSTASAHPELVFGHADQDGSTMADTALWDEAAAEGHYVELDGLFARTL